MGGSQQREYHRASPVSAKSEVHTAEQAAPDQLHQQAVRPRVAREDEIQEWMNVAGIDRPPPRAVTRALVSTEAAYDNWIESQRSRCTRRPPGPRDRAR